DLSNHSIEFYNNLDETDWKVYLIDTGLNILKGGRIKRVEKYLDPDMNMVTYGDGVANIDIQKLVNYHKSHGKMVTITGVHPPARFGEINEKNGKILTFKEKPDISKTLINGGFMVFNNSLLDYLTSDEDCEFESEALYHLSQKKEVRVYKHQGHWECMDHERDYEYLNKLWNNNQAFWKLWP
ncbi:MAG: sugar phosphate nucleotidyltransferase, partial [Promethearchaeota archaeon]